MFLEDHFQQVVQCVEGTSDIRCQTYARTEDHNYRTQTQFQFTASPSPFLDTTENATFAHFIKKSMRLKTGFLLDYQVLFLLLKEPQSKKKFNRSIS